MRRRQVLWPRGRLLLLDFLPPRQPWFDDPTPAETLDLMEEFIYRPTSRPHFWDLVARIVLGGRC